MWKGVWVSLTSPSVSSLLNTTSKRVVRGLFMVSAKGETQTSSRKDNVVLKVKGPNVYGEAPAKHNPVCFENSSGELCLGEQGVHRGSADVL